MDNECRMYLKYFLACKVAVAQAVPVHSGNVILPNSFVRSSQFEECVDIEDMYVKCMANKGFKPIQGTKSLFVGHPQ